MNSWTIIGNLGKDPDMSYTPSALAVTRMSVAVDTYNSQTKSRSTMWVPVVCFDSLAERCNQYLHSGSKIAVIGRVSIRKYTGRDNHEHTSVECIADKVEFLTPVKDRPTGNVTVTEVPPADDNYDPAADVDSMAAGGKPY